MLAAAFQIDDGAFAKLGMAHALAQLVAGIVLADRRAHAAVIDRARYAGAQAHFFHTLFRQFADKARRPMVNLFAVQTARFGIGQRQFLHGRVTPTYARRRSSQTAAFIQRHLAREHAFFHADDKHQRELQALAECRVISCTAS